MEMGGERDIMLKKGSAKVEPITMSTNSNIQMTTTTTDIEISTLPAEKHD